MADTLSVYNGTALMQFNDKPMNLGRFVPIRTDVADIYKDMLSDNNEITINSTDDNLLGSFALDSDIGTIRMNDLQVLDIRRQPSILAKRSTRLIPNAMQLAMKAGHKITMYMNGKEVFSNDDVLAFRKLSNDLHMLVIESDYNKTTLLF